VRRPLRVLHFLWDGGVGGMERAVWLLVREQLRDPDLEPTVLFAKGAGPYAEWARESGVPVIDLHLPNGRALTRVRAAAAQMCGYDVHHFHTPDPLLMLASSLCRGTRRVYTQRGGTTEYTLGKRVKHGIAGWMLRRWFHGFSGNTAHGADCGSALYGIPRDRFHVTYNGIEESDLVPGREPAEVRAELGLAPDDFVVGTSANLKPWKRIDLLIRAVAALGDGATRLVIVGDGVDRARLESVADELGVEPRVLFTGLVLQVPDYLQVMDAFCLPSTGLESFGNSAVEAMLLGVPTIVFADSRGLVEHIEDGKTGFVVADQHELRQRLELLKSDPSLRHEVGALGRETVRERYTPARAAAAYRDLYASVFPAGSALRFRKDAVEEPVA
jgi:glycosyltransferase involved in cell wall biosynthesis